MDSYKKSESFVMEPIGIIHSPYNTKSETPIQPIYSSTIGKVEIFSDYLEGLIDLQEFSHIYLLYVFDRSLKYQLQVKPFKDNQLHGLFSTRHPNRPNPIGISIVQIIEIYVSWSDHYYFVYTINSPTYINTSGCGFIIFITNS